MTGNLLVLPVKSAALRAAIPGLDNTGAAIVRDLCRRVDWVAYSRRAEHYSVDKRYRTVLYTRRRVIAQIDLLDRLGWIEHRKVWPGPHNDRQSTAFATPELRELVHGIMRGGLDLWVPPIEPIILRDPSGREAPYRDTRARDRDRRRVELLNEALGGAKVAGCDVGPLRRIYNGTFRRGGRFYAAGPSWQNIRKAERGGVTIAGEPTVELDYKAIHPAILYAEARRSLPADCYAIDPWPRPLVKVAMLILINAETERSAKLAIVSGDAIEELAPKCSGRAWQLVHRLVDDIKARHAPIAHAFHSDAGAVLMAADARLAEAVMVRMLVEHGETVLPVHDSFLARASKATELEIAMLEAAHQAGFDELTVEGPTTPEPAPKPASKTARKTARPLS